jgi:hypothetical protein
MMDHDINNQDPARTDDRTIRVFITSTFRDMHAERDVLITVVFPELRERIERLGLEFFDVDLRWDVPLTGVDGESANSWAYSRTEWKKPVDKKADRVSTVLARSDLVQIHQSEPLVQTKCDITLVGTRKAPAILPEYPRN